MSEQQSTPQTINNNQYHEEDGEIQPQLSPNELKASDFEALSDAAIAVEKDLEDRGEEPLIISVK